MSINENLKKLGLELPPAPPKGGLYTPCMRFGPNGSLCYISGCGPNIGDDAVSGKLGAEFTVEQGQEYARRCMLNVLAVLKAEIGDLDRVKKAVKILAFVAGTDTFYQQPAVANGASELLMDLLGHVPSRSAIGTNALPGNIPVEIEAIFEVDA